MNFTKSKKLQQRSHALIPGGCHTYAKGDDHYPVLAPGFIVRGQGCHVWDVDGNEYIEYGMGNRCVTLGHAFSPVVEAAKNGLENGVNFSRPSPIELECAEELLSVIDGADMVKFCKNGSDATTAALKLARAYTGRDLVACCADHPFFSINDWFIGTTPMDAGIPKVIKDLTLSFHYNNIESIKSLFDRYPGQIACLILEPAKYEDPKDSFLHEVQAVCKQNGTVFILDEMITGFRWHIGGGQKYYDIVPDLSAFGKGMSNGFSVSALVGKKEIMKLGGLNHDRERVFLLSTTHGAETHSLAATMEVIKTYKREPVIDTLYRQVERLTRGIKNIIEKRNLFEYFQVIGKPCNLVFITKDQEKKPSQSFRSLFLQEIIKRGVIGPSLVVSYSHSDEDIDRTVEVFDEALEVYQNALEDGVDRFLVGRPSKSVNRKFN